MSSSNLFPLSFSQHRSRSRRAQAALEYLTTYGFALLALLITLGVINYFGIFNPNTLRSSVCEFQPGITCKDYYLGPSTPPPITGYPAGPYLQVLLINDFGTNLTANAFTFRSELFDIQNCKSDAAAWAAGSAITVYCPLPPTFYVKAQRYDGVVNMSVNQQGGSYAYQFSGHYSVIAQ